MGRIRSRSSGIVWGKKGFGGEGGGIGEQKPSEQIIPQASFRGDG